MCSEEKKFREKLKWAWQMSLSHFLNLTYSFMFSHYQEAKQLVDNSGYLVVTSGYLIATTGYVWLLFVNSGSSF